MVKICGYRDVIGIANSIELDGATRTRVISVGLVGEITGSGEHGALFQRGVSRYPPLGAPVTTVTSTDLLTVYARPTSCSRPSSWSTSCWRSTLLSGVPSEIADVVVLVTSRVLFDFTSWSDPARRPPILLACEEAHRYLPAAAGNAFAACTRAISRIAREGRKYCISLALISQRPSELSPQALSQCGTVFALRLGNDLDQRFVEGALPDTGQMMMGALSSLPAQHAVVFGEAVSLPMHGKSTPPASSSVTRRFAAGACAPTKRSRYSRAPTAGSSRSR
ncbi:MAG: ATP-binding protein [Candidatus Cybelea sp.]